MIFRNLLLFFIVIYSSNGFAQDCGSPDFIDAVMKSYYSGAISHQQAVNEGIKHTRCLSELLKVNGVQNQLSTGEQIYISITPNSATTIGQFAAELEAYYDSKLKFDFLYFLERPYSAGTYIRESKKMVIGAHSLLKFYREDPLVLHELIHIKSWHRIIKGERHYFQGVFFGPTMTPNELWLDEILAYENDIAWTLHKLKSWLTSAPSTDESPRLKEMLNYCFEDQQPSKDLSTTEALWHTLCRKSIIKGWHTEPALAVVKGSESSRQNAGRTYSGISWNSIRWGKHEGLWPIPFGGASTEFISKLKQRLEYSFQRNLDFQKDLRSIVESENWRDDIQNLRMFCELELSQLLENSAVKKSCI